MRAATNTSYYMTSLYTVFSLNRKEEIRYKNLRLLYRLLLIDEANMF